MGIWIVKGLKIQITAVASAVKVICFVFVFIPVFIFTPWFTIFSAKFTIESVARQYKGHKSLQSGENNEKYQRQGFGTP